MNRSFDPLDLVNTYGAFGNVDRERHEVILEGTRDAVPDASARWEEYELPCMPGDPRRRPCLVSPYHYRLDWQMWFVGNDAARGEAIEDEPWLVHLVWQLLRGEPGPTPALRARPLSRRAAAVDPRGALALSVLRLASATARGGSASESASTCVPSRPTTRAFATTSTRTDGRTRRRAIGAP